MGQSSLFSAFGLAPGPFRTNEVVKGNGLGPLCWLDPQPLALGLSVLRFFVFIPTLDDRGAAWPKTDSGLAALPLSACLTGCGFLKFVSRRSAGIPLMC